LDAAIVNVTNANSAANTRPRKLSATERCSITVEKTQRMLPPQWAIPSTISAKTRLVAAPNRM